MSSDLEKLRISKEHRASRETRSSWPIVLLLAPPDAEAFFVPVAPAFPCTYAAPSALFVERIANSWVIPLGASKVFFALTPKKPTTTSPGTVVVIDGA